MGWTSIDVPKGERQSNLEFLKRHSWLFIGRKWSSSRLEMQIEALRAGTGAVYGIIRHTEVATGRFVRLALIILIERKGDKVAYKEITEDRGPHHLGYPEAFFNRLSPLDEIAALTHVNVSYAAEWREKLEKMYKASKALKCGDVIELADPVSFSIDGESVEVQRFRIETWGKRRSFTALPLRGGEFRCRLRRYTWANTTYQVVV